ncbi:MAG: hypothetical protein HY921_11790 [Elusimicrobia bacterium]|nr:hypothetical protein [Elusimicrobiota bacterium]
MTATGRALSAFLFLILELSPASAEPRPQDWDLADLRMQGEVPAIRETTKAFRKSDPLLPAAPALEAIFRNYPVILFGFDHTHMTSHLYLESILGLMKKSGVTHLVFEYPYTFQKFLDEYRERNNLRGLHELGWYLTSPGSYLEQRWLPQVIWSKLHLMRAAMDQGIEVLTVDMAKKEMDDLTRLTGDEYLMEERDNGMVKRIMGIFLSRPNDPKIKVAAFFGGWHARRGNQPFLFRDKFSVPAFGVQLEPGYRRNPAPRLRLHSKKDRIYDASLYIPFHPDDKPDQDLESQH